MILRIIDEIEKALNHDLYFAALNLALTLPDICGKAEYPSLRSTRERYIPVSYTHLDVYKRQP